MQLSEYCGYIGRMKQPMELMRDNPTMFVLMDEYKREFDLILLTPGTFLHAYNFIKKINPVSVRLFIPTLNMEFVSDIFNLYMTLKDKMLIKWVFPDKVNHSDFSDGQIRCNTHINEFNHKLSITYVKNECVDGVYDIIARSSDAVHYFSQYLTQSDAKNLYEDSEYDYIHIPESSTLYGGECYRTLSSKYQPKFVPHSFVSITELYSRLHRDVPQDEISQEIPVVYKDTITDLEILDVMSSRIYIPNDNNGISNGDIVDLITNEGGEVI